MERLEAADASVAAQEAAIAEINAEGARVSAEGKAAVAAATAAWESASRDRGALAARVPADLLAFYERLAARAWGPGHSAAARARRVTWSSPAPTCRRCVGWPTMTSSPVRNAARSSSAPTSPVCDPTAVMTTATRWRVVGTAADTQADALCIVDLDADLVELGRIILPRASWPAAVAEAPAPDAVRWVWSDTARWYRGILEAGATVALPRSATVPRDPPHERLDR